MHSTLKKTFPFDCVEFERDYAQLEAGLQRGVVLVEAKPTMVVTVIAADYPRRIDIHF
jgi:hypothetical protein